MAAATVVSWLTPYRMGPRAILYAFEIATKMSLQLIAVCAAAGIIVGVIALTGIGTRFSSLLLGLAGQSQIVALFFAMIVAIILGMGMPTTAAYAVAASVIAPGLIQMGIQPLLAHFFIFYFAVMSAITPPVALAAYAGAAIAQVRPDEDKRRGVQVRPCRFRGAVHVLRLARASHAGGMGRDPSRHGFGGLRGVPAVSGGAGLVHGRAQPCAPCARGARRARHDRRRVADGCGGAWHGGGGLGDPAPHGDAAHSGAGAD
jgi:hypothetical protein